MIKSKRYKIISLSLAFLMLLSSSGLTLDVHFCQGKMKRLNLFGEAKSCAEVSQMAKKCHSSKSSNTCDSNGDHKGCCDNKSFDLDLDFDAGEAFVNTFTDVQIQFAEAFVLSYYADTRPSPTLHNFTNYYPPPLKRDISVLFQTFLL